MTADLSRDTFDPRKRHAGVVMQQGRVQLDADWNEQQAIARHYAETQTMDVVGPTGAPVHAPGFNLTTDGAKVTIGAGRFYLGGLLCENPADVDYTLQPDFPNPPALAQLFSAAGTTSAVFYLEAWRREVSGVEDPEIREVALGGADTALRLKTVWQVKALPVAPPASGGVTCGTALSEWDALTAPTTGLMSARAQPSASSGNPCLMPPAAGYQRLENQLYRIEIHKGGDRSVATFKWSRDNASVVTAVEAFNGQELTVHDLGRDASLGFANGQSVELTSDAVELGGQPGPLLTVDHVDEATRLIALKTAPAAVAAALHPKLRRWDGGEIALSSATTADGWIELESGVQVKFEAGSYQAGDYWLAPARTLTGQLDWPFTTPQRPRNPPHAFCRLGVGVLNSNVLSLQDCRMLFRPIAEGPPAMHVTGVNWVHDDVISQQNLQTSGLEIFFDGPMTAPAGDSGQAIISVVLDTPAPLKTINPAATVANAVFRLSTPLTGDVSMPSPTTLLWKPTQGGAELSNLAAFLISENIQRARLQVSLRGSMIWADQGAERLFLDGRVYGKPGVRADSTPRIDLTLPSGDGSRSSDFESWLYLQLQIPPPNLIQLKLDTAVVNPGTPVNATVVLDRPAQTAVAVTLASSADPPAHVPANVQVPVGATQATFPITTAAPASTTQVVISATALGATQQAPLTVQLVNLAVTPAEVTIFVGGSQQFSAQESGSVVAQGVTWSISGPAGGAISPSGLFTGKAAGDYQAIATSNADHTRTKAGIVHVKAKPKDNKETKEKDNDKVSDKSRVVDKSVVVEKISDRVAVGNNLALNPLLAPRAVAANDGEPDAATGRAFIRPEERPDLSLRATG
jgi:hypothetical protein